MFCIEAMVKEGDRQSLIRMQERLRKELWVIWTCGVCMDQKTTKSVCSKRITGARNGKDCTEI